MRNSGEMDNKSRMIGGDMGGINGNNMGNKNEFYQTELSHITPNNNNNGEYNDTISLIT